MPSTATKTFALLLGVLFLAASSRGDTVISNLDPVLFPVTTVGSPPFPAITGQSFITGPTDMVLQDVKIELDPANLPTSTPTLVLEDSVSAVDPNNSQQFDAPGSILPVDLVLTATDPNTGILTFTANSPFILAGGGVNYWIVATPNAPDTGLSWSFNAPAPNLLTTDGYTIQPNAASFISFSDIGSATYFDPANEVQLFQLDAVPAMDSPEPSTISLALIATCALFLYQYSRIRARRRHPRPVLH